MTDHYSGFEGVLLREGKNAHTVAGSMSKTADLGPVEPRPAATAALTPPAATLMPTPAFSVLRPTWLPEPMAVREQVKGEMVVLDFDPRPESSTPYAVMTLTESPKRSVSGAGGADPQATTEQIGDYAITVIRRGEGWTAFEWDAGELHFSLTNVYDPPGQLRYSCEKLRKLVAAIE